MKVERAESMPDPGYPSKRQFAESAKLLGIAAAGLGVLLAAGCDAKPTGGVPVRTGGKPMVEPAPRLLGDIAVDPKVEPQRLRGEMAAEPVPEPPRRTGGIVAEEPRPEPPPPPVEPPAVPVSMGKK